MSMWDTVAIDWGEKNCGLAFGNSQTSLIVPDQKANPTEQIIEILKEEISLRKPLKIVVGLPTNFKLQKTKVSEQIEKFILELKSIFDLEVITINERGTTQQANFMKNLQKFQLDNLSAQQILQIYFNTFQ